jgi:cytochrome c-type protein NapB
MKKLKQIYILSNHFTGWLKPWMNSAVLITYGWILFMSMGFILFPAAVYQSMDSIAASSEVPMQSTDPDGIVTFENNDLISKNQPADESTKRTLSLYYSRRQYPGAPPEIPHPLEAHGTNLECLICHADGGWTTTLKGMTPVTPHPGLTSCLQCHFWFATDTLFKDSLWQKFAPPRRGRSYLPGAPPSIPHDLQMRTNCSACHESPAAVVEIRMKHQWQGDCRQCHVHDYPVKPFRR